MGSEGPRIECGQILAALDGPSRIEKDVSLATLAVTRPGMGGWQIGQYLRSRPAASSADQQSFFK